MYNGISQCPEYRPESQRVRGQPVIGSMSKGFYARCGMIAEAPRKKFGACRNASAEKEPPPDR
jgi:hypothetical protein